MSPDQAGLGGRETLGHVVDGDVLVHRIRLDVLVEEVECVLAKTETAESLRVRLLGMGEVISKAARWPTMAPLSRRCSPKKDIRLTVARVTAGILSR